MKKMLFLFSLIIATSNLFAQFRLTKEGFVDAKDPEKSYIVLDTNGRSKEESFKDVLKHLTILYKSAKDVISKVDNEVITINAKEPNTINCKTLDYDLSYTVTVSFKDNRIKIDAPTFNCTSFAYNKPYRLTMSGSNGGFGSEVTVGLFKKNGEEGQKKTISQINVFFNNLVSAIHDAANGVADGDTEDW